uniref:(northern house mosquito) hypothetical protein n=1 Tax=Culex pipiens TaxID=7175 RepID=A0A8D7ZXE7_CULPI
MEDWPTTRRRCFLADLTAASQSPPKWGAPGGIKCQFIPSWEHSCWMCSWCFACLRLCRRSLRSFFAPTKFVPLSEYMSAGFPRRATNRRSAWRNLAVDRSETSSKWTALVPKQTNTAT